MTTKVSLPRGNSAIVSTLVGGEVKKVDFYSSDIQIASVLVKQKYGKPTNEPYATDTVKTAIVKLRVLLEELK